MHSSVRLNTPIEFINVTPVNPLISKCQIKVCWVGEEPNRNRTIITKDTAKEMAKSLPGSPIVGYYNEETKDFEGHNREFSIENGQITSTVKSMEQSCQCQCSKCHGACGHRVNL